VLTISEQLFLVSIDDDRGQVTSYVSDPLKYGLAGALLAELALQGKIALKGKKFVIKDQDPTGDKLLDDVLARIVKGDRAHKPTYWVNALASRKLLKQIAGQLAAKNIIQIEEKRYLWVIPDESHPETDAPAKYWVKHHLRSVVLASEEAPPHTLVLLGLLKACRLLNLIFTRDEQSAASKKVDALVKGEEFGKVVARTIANVEAAAYAESK
jgi:hypothetical protein